MVAVAVMAVVVVLAAVGEALHGRGGSGGSLLWRSVRTDSRPGGLTGRAYCGSRQPVLLPWGLTTLLTIDPKLHAGGEEIPDNEKRHLIIVLDVSPSMRLKDAGPEGKQTGRHDRRDVLDSMFARVGVRQYLITVIATYNGAIPIVERSHDPEILRNAMNDLPMHYAFKRETPTCSPASRMPRKSPGRCPPAMRRC